MLEKEIIRTIHKSNLLIQTTSKEIKTLSPNSLLLLDNIYFELQKFLNKNDKLILKKSIVINIKQTTIKEWLNIKNNTYTREIRSVIKSLTKPIELKNYEENGEKVRWGIKHFIKNVNEKRDTEDNKTIIYSIEIDTFLFQNVLNLKNNFTQINLKYQKNFKSNNTIRLYQYLKSIKKIQNNVLFDIKFIQDFFDINVKTYNTISMCKRFLETHIKNINKITDIKVELEVNKKSKTFMFKITQTKKEKNNKEEVNLQFINNNNKDNYYNASEEDLKIIERILNNKK